MGKTQWMLAGGVLVALSLLALLFTKSPIRPNCLTLQNRIARAEVIAWDPAARRIFLSGPKDCRVEITIIHPQTAIIIPINKPAEPLREQLILTPGSQWYAQAFCPGDIAEIEMADNSATGIKSGTFSGNIKSVRNKGPRSCGR